MEQVLYGFFVSMLLHYLHFIVAANEIKKELLEIQEKQRRLEEKLGKN